MKKIPLFVLNSILLVSVAALTGCSTESGTKLEKKQEELVVDWEVRDEYVKDGMVLFSVYPNPVLVAGKSFGYLFHFNEPFEVFEGKELAIYAYHKETGEKITVLSPQTITEPSLGYSSLERFTVTFEVPIGGLWRYEVVLDNEFYGDVVMEVKEASKVVLPDDIPDFVKESDFNSIDWEKKAVEFGDRGIIGNENKSGVIGADMPTLNGQKWMWHLWDVENVELTVVGFNRETETVYQVLFDGPDGASYWTRKTGGENNGADAHIPSTVKLSERGEWAFLLYSNGELFDILVYDIKE